MRVTAVEKVPLPAIFVKELSESCDWRELYTTQIIKLLIVTLLKVIIGWPKALNL